MTLADLIKLFRARAKDDAVPYLWQDDELLEYIVAGQDELVRAMGGIRDVTVGTPAAGRISDITVTADDPYSATSQWILHYRRGRLITAGRDIDFKNMGDLDTAWFSDYGITTADTLDDTDTGEVRFGLLDVRENYIRWLRVPDTSDTCRLWFSRLPYPRITDDTGTLEVADDHHIHLVDYMMGAAFEKPDEEIYDKAKSERAYAKFYAYADKARKQHERKAHKPRQVTYGGITW